MAVRTTDGPEWQWGTTEQAASYLGVSKSTLLRLVAMPEYAWVRASKLGKKSVRWHWFDVVCLSHILHRQGTELPEDDED